MKRHARTARRLIRTTKKSKFRQAKVSRKYKHGWEFQKTMYMPYNLVFKMVIINGRMLLTWKLNESRDIRYSKIMEGLFLKKDKIANAPKGYQKIRVHFVFDVKHHGKFKARLVADGHRTKEPNETVYSGVVSLRNLRLAMFMGSRCWKCIPTSTYKRKTLHCGWS